MIVISCYSQERGLAAPTNGFDLSRQIRIALSCHYYLSLAVKMGVSPTRTRQDEWTVRDELHEYFAFFPSVRVRRGLQTNCDICSLVDVVRRLAFSRDGALFIEATRRGEVERAKYDWVEAFEELLSADGVRRDRGFGERVERAKKIMQFIQSFTPASFVESAEPQLVTMTVRSDIMGTEDLLSLVRIQLKALRHGHLRMIG